MSLRCPYVEEGRINSCAASSLATAIVSLLDARRLYMLVGDFASITETPRGYPTTTTESPGTAALSARGIALTVAGTAAGLKRSTATSWVGEAFTSRRGTGFAMSGKYATCFSMCG